MKTYELLDHVRSEGVNGLYYDRIIIKNVKTKKQYLVRECFSGNYQWEKVRYEIPSEYYGWSIADLEEKDIFSEGYRAIDFIYGMNYENIEPFPQMACVLKSLGFSSAYNEN